MLNLLSLLSLHNHI